MKLYILNDDVNSFEHVIHCIQKYLNYPHMQGASIAHIVNDTGKCLVKESDDEMMRKEIYEGLVKQGLSLRIEN